jgi:hypothetical protein
MNCPFCKKELVNGENRKFQSAPEHVSDPNYISPPRPTKICLCEESKIYFWDKDGSVYLIKNSDYLKHAEDSKKFNGVEALNSFAREVEEELNARFHKRAFAI